MSWSEYTMWEHRLRRQDDSVVPSVLLIVGLLLILLHYRLVGVFLNVISGPVSGQYLYRITVSHNLYMYMYRNEILKVIYL